MSSPIDAGGLPIDGPPMDGPPTDGGPPTDASGPPTDASGTPVESGTPGAPIRHVVTTRDFTRADLERLIAHAEWIRTAPRAVLRDRLAGVVVATLFYEPSTRTRLSFEAAAARLGAAVISAENAKENSSAKKGESLPDVFRVVGSYADAIVIRHHEATEIAAAVPFSPVPIVSAGAGAGEHPTQALLDVYTLWREFGRVDELRVCVLGDLKYGRTVHSLLRLLTQFTDVEATLVHQPGLPLPDALKDELQAAGMKLRETTDFAEALRTSDAVYQTRIQRERFDQGLDDTSLESALYGIGPQHLEMMKQTARILHPLPRVGEIDPAVDTDERAAYFRQAENGLYMRMALLDDILGGIMR
ncbi:aspartate carbamoyltransferase [Alicyclobacillus cycloheptanicus]|uniref:Aspartate carbamoyltransferase n=1 Tax=Alicyclobacillus cycloheptanicus TaxID=1457 RepID=A0ABT9XL01_9BACL|nr:aspartate carbamoyltransferase [Alicyclobacillus cycloheptanicus]MDQ0190994.1 aspartate carbamoyltransferase catalytic subunit [Alicyclobacillus cycloheptanicus]